jgi:transposase
MSRHDSELADEQWRKIEPLLPRIKCSKVDGRKAVEDWWFAMNIRSTCSKRSFTSHAY